MNFSLLNVQILWTSIDWLDLCPILIISNYCCVSNTFCLNWSVQRWKDQSSLRRIRVWFFFPLTVPHLGTSEGDVEKPQGLLGCACVTAALRAPNNKFSIKNGIGSDLPWAGAAFHGENSQLEFYRAALCSPCSCCRCRPGPVPCSRWALPVHNQFSGQGDQQTGIRTAWNSEVRDTSLHSCWDPKVPVLGKPLPDVGSSKTGGYGAWKEVISEVPPKPVCDSMILWIFIKCYFNELSFSSEILLECVFCLKLKNKLRLEGISAGH